MEERSDALDRNLTDFMFRGLLTSQNGPLRAQGSALTRNFIIIHGSKNWLQRAILYRQEDISVSGKIAGNIKVKLYVRLRCLFDDISGLMYSFELASFVVQDIIILLPWIAAGPSRKSI